MKLKSTLEDWLKSPPKKSLKKGGDNFPYFSKYESFKYELDKIHGETTKAAILVDIREKIEKAKKDGTKLFDLESIIWLNDHGPNHVKTVINRVSDLINGTELELNVREVYILLLAIHLHDIGNFYGRTGHENKIYDVINNLLPSFTFDTTESNYIAKIAKVHGGKILNQKNTPDNSTIHSIKPVVTAEYYEIQKRLLASLLRFSDELADDKSRADSKLLFERAIPKSSEIFHAYSFCLDSVLIKHNLSNIELHFKVPKELIESKIGKRDSEVYLLDEIYDRVLKMHTERNYCAKFWGNKIGIDKIWVRIEFYSRNYQSNSFSEADLFVHDDITFTLHDDRYPLTPDDIFNLCSDLKYPDGKFITGENLLEKIKKH